jgi:Methyltransferase domain
MYFFKKRFFLIFSSVVISVIQCDLPPPYDSAQILPFFEHSWYNNQNEIESLINEYRIKTIIEVGSWLGSSTRHMAQCVPEDGIVFAVDHWKGSIEHQEGQSCSVPGLDLDKLYAYFLSNTIQSGLAHKIVPIRMESLQAAAELKVQVDLIYIDASHDEESVYKDLEAWYPHLNNNGILCGDDWPSFEVRNAVTCFAQKYGLHIIANNFFWKLQR